MTSEKAEPEALESMKTSPYNYEDTKWAAFQNKALDSASCGHLQFLAIGSKNTFKEVPKHFPDTQHGLGWKYLFIGWVDLETGEVKDDDPNMGDFRDSVSLLGISPSKGETDG